MSNKDKVLEFIARFEALDVHGVMATFSDNAFYHNIPMEPLNGIDDIRGFIEPFMEPITEISWEVLFIAEDDNGVVLTERVDTFVFGDKQVVMPVMGTFEFENGKLAKWRDHFDLQMFEVQMAALNE
jgi:limonene-1,2-epoxide hydrolase